MFVMALKVELHTELNNAWLTSRSEAGKLARRSLRAAFDADIRNPQLIQCDLQNVDLSMIGGAYHCAIG